VREHPDIGLPVCDTCLHANQKQEQEISAAHVLRDDVVPDAVDGTASGAFVFIGPKESAVNLATLDRLGITRILICCDSLKAIHAPTGTLRYHRLPVADSLDQNLTAFLPSALAFIAQGVLAGERTLVHCNAGVSRSGAVVVAWLQQTQQLAYDDALGWARRGRKNISPNSNFEAQLRAF
jgi:hypothetical protein